MLHPLTAHHEKLFTPQHPPLETAVFHLSVATDAMTIPVIGARGHFESTLCGDSQFLPATTKLRSSTTLF